MINRNISNELKIYELSLIWREAEYNFAFWERLAGSLDWDKAYREALSAVLQTKNTYEYYLELKKFVSLLRDGHTGVWFPKEIEDSPDYTSKLPIRTQFIGGERVITNVKRSAADKVKRWSIIKKINGMDINEYAEKHIYPYIWHEKKDSADYWINLFLSDGPSGSSVELEFEYEGKTETAVLTRMKGDTDWFYTDSTPKPDENLREEYKSDSHRIAMTEDNIAVITIDTMDNNNLPNEFYANFPLLEKARGYIIDVRYNGGGFQICTMHCTYPDGREFINIGVKPHIPCEMTLNDYKNGVDSVLNKGLEVIRGMTEE
jgi:C-terminal processing protease CtpA/Prc